MPGSCFDVDRWIKPSLSCKHGEEERRGVQVLGKIGAHVLAVCSAGRHTSSSVPRQPSPIAIMASLSAGVKILYNTVQLCGCSMTVMLSERQEGN